MFSSLLSTLRRPTAGAVVADTPFSAAEVRALLSPVAPASERRERVVCAASRPGLWADRLPTPARSAQVTWKLRERLPTVVLLHASGADLDAIALRSGVYRAWEAERALDAACAAIAVALNAARRHATAGHDGGRAGGRS